MSEEYDISDKEVPSVDTGSGEITIGTFVNGEPAFMKSVGDKGVVFELETEDGDEAVVMLFDAAQNEAIMRKFR